MHKLAFSDEMEKMPPKFQFSKLLQVLKSNYEELTPDFIRYDTKLRWKKGNAELPKSGKCLILLLAADSGNGALWTTVRSASDKYTEMIESIVQIHIPPTQVEESIVERFGLERISPPSQIPDGGREG